MLISKEYVALNKKLHADNPHYGISGGQFAQYTRHLVTDEGYESVLDWGCGKGTLKQVCPELPIAEYDPAIEGKDALPEPADLVVCTDVLEHIEKQHLNAVLRHLKSVTRCKLLFNISCRESQKTLADGRNAHLIVKTPDWWRAKLQEHFQIVEWFPNPNGESVHGEAFPIEGKVATLADRAKMKRRPMTPVWRMMFSEIVANSAKYIDDFSRIRDVRMWEGVDDEPSDMQAVINILSDMSDIDMAFKKAMSLSRRGIMVAVPLTPTRTEAMWRSFFKKRLRISDWHVSPDGLGLVVSGAHLVPVQGINAIGAVATDDRFEQVKKAVGRVSKRISPTRTITPKRAIIACYGPSLADNINVLREEAADSECAIISVSGAHDYLLSQGIVPDYHVECDPRPHKALNIDHAHPQVQYLIASCCHPDVFDKLEGADVALWHVSTPEHCKSIVDELGESGAHMVSGGGSVGLRTLPLFYCMGFRSFSIYGMDCSFKVGGGTQWAGPHAGKRQDVVQCRCDMPDGTARIFDTSPILLTYASSFFETIQKVEDASFRLYGEGLLQSMCELYAYLPQLEQEAA